MDHRNVIITAILGLVLILVLTLHYKKEPIEEALRAETTKVLEEVGLTVDVIKFDGRDATLGGEVASEEEKERIEALVSDVWDVRVVNNQLAIKTPADSDSTLVAKGPVVKGFKMTQGVDGALLLRGQVHDESTRNKVVAAVLDAFPALSIQNEIEVVAGEPETWFTPLLRVIAAISVVKNPEIEIPENGNTLVLKGAVGAEIQKKAVLEDLNSALLETLQLDEKLRVEIEERDPKLVALEKRIQDLQTTTRIQFKINTAFLADLSKVVLDQVADILKEAPSAQIEVEGHTDNLGKTQLNMELSQLRADAVRDYLISKGIQASRLTSVGYGPTRPVATNTTRQGRITNRRVVFSLKGGS
ncbi:MAG: OmpA family protein [Rhodothermales bacterium]